MHQTIQASYRLSALHIFWPITQFGLRIVEQIGWTILLERDTTRAHVIFGTIRWVWIETIWFPSATKRSCIIKERTWNSKEQKGIENNSKTVNNPSSLNKRNHNRKSFRLLILILHWISPIKIWWSWQAFKINFQLLNYQLFNQWQCPCHLV